MGAELRGSLLNIYRTKLLPFFRAFKQSRNRKTIMSDCLFCRITAGKVPAYKVYENDRVSAFLDINPSAIGHVLIIPRTHVSRIEDLSILDAEALFKALHRLVKPIRMGVGADAVMIGVNDGPGSGQEVPHVHIHVIPRSSGDGGSIIQSAIHIRKLVTEKLEITAEKIRRQLSLSVNP
jgi:histidine triad (HIT) family protein